MLALLSLLLGVGAAWNEIYTMQNIKEIDTYSTFKEWVKAFNRSYDTIEQESNKYVVWLDNLESIAHSNSLNKSYILGLNQFSDMTADEFRYYVHGEKGSCLTTNYDSNSDAQKDWVNIGNGIKDLPESVDWTTKGVVTPVKDQGACGSCWAFASTGTLECNYAIKTGTLTSLSEQQLVDCSRPNGCQGCNGCSDEKALNYTKDAGGVCSETEYPYIGKDGVCKSSSCGTKYDANTGYIKVTANNETAMATAVSEGCIAVGIEADQTAFQHYSSGVLTGTCGTSIDHAVLIVGYGTMQGQDYWKVKNSWGKSWGMDGYILICRNCDKNDGEGECGILQDGCFPTF